MNEPTFGPGSADETPGAGNVQLVRTSDTLLVDQSLQLKAIVGATPGSSLAPVWKSSDSTIAAVTQGGIVFALRSGTAVVSVTNRGATDATTLTIRPSLRQLRFDADTLAIGLRQSVKLPFRAIDSDGNPVDLAKHVVRWSSTDPEVAPVTGTGSATVHGKMLGATDVRLSVDGKATQMRVRVKPQPVSSVAITPAPLVLEVAQQTQLDVVTADASGTPLANRKVSWRSSNEGVAVVSSTGTVTPIAVGSADIIAMSEGKKGVSELTVQPVGSGGNTTPTTPAPSQVTIASVSLTLNADQLTVGQSTQANAVLKDSASNVLTGRTVSWTSSDESIATVDGDGLVVAVRTGSAVVTASAGGQSADAVIVVSSPTQVPQTIALSLNATTLYVGDLTQAYATVKDANGTTISDASVSWSTSPSAVATVSVNGMVMARSAGTATVTATSSGVSRSATVTVLSPPDPTSSEPFAPAGPTGAWNGTATVAELPRASVSTTYPSGLRQVRVAAGANLQDALNAAQPGDELLLAPGATYTGEFVLPNKGGSTSWIVIRTDVSDAALGSAGTRMTPSRARALNLARILTPTNQAALRTAPASHHYRITGVEVSATGGQDVYSLIDFGSADRSVQPTLSAVPTNLILDRSYVHGSSTLNLRRCLNLNSATSAVIDSWLGECHSNAGDSQGISGLNGPGPFLIQNNTLEAGHMAFMFGGGDPAISQLVPSDITVRGNHMTRPASWKGVWQTKTIVETKNARRLLIEGNLIENIWADAQVGFAIIFKSVNQDGGCGWCTTSDVTVRYNRIRNVGGVYNIAARPEYHPAIPAARITIHDNITDNVNVGAFNGPGIGLQVIGDVSDLIFAHETIIAPTGNSSTMFDGNPNTRFVFHSNVISNGYYGVFGSGKGSGTVALNYYAPNWLFSGNAIVGAHCGSYPTATYCPTGLAAVGFVNPGAGDYRLSSSSIYAGKGYDGKDLGADQSKVSAATAGAIVTP